MLDETHRRRCGGEDGPYRHHVTRALECVRYTVSESADLDRALIIGGGRGSSTRVRTLCGATSTVATGEAETRVEVPLIKAFERRNYVTTG